MIFVFGGAYQGKSGFAKETFSLSQQDIFTCDGEYIDFSKKCIDSIERFTLYCAGRGLDPVAVFAANRASWENSILICRDISCGVVPIEAQDRLWQRLNGRLCQYLSGQADRVSRIFCGLEQRLK